MKQCLKTLLLFLLPLQMLAQPELTAKDDITGLWKGTVITRELNLPYELIITRQNGVLTGYSHTSFTVRGEEIVSVKKLKLTFKKDHIIIEDDDLLFNNFTEEAPKKIKQTNTVTLETSGKVWRLYGTFEAKALRMLKPADGTVELEKKDSPADSKLYAKLGELNLSNTISFAFSDSDKQTTAVAVVDKPVIEKTNASPEFADYGKRVTIPADSAVLVKTIPPTPPAPASPNQRTEVLAKQENSEIVITAPVVINASKRSGVVVNKPPSVKKTVTAPKIINSTAKIAPLETGIPQKTMTPVPVVTAKTIAKATVPASVTAGKPSTVAKQPAPSNPVVVNKPITVPPKPTSPVTAKATPAIKVAPVNIVVAPALDLAKRKIETIQQLYIESDSLQFTLYDNGEVDGDTVSVALNGKTIVSRQGLNTTAFTKTVYMTPDLGDSIQLIMYAENLGTLAPNTGLLVLQYDNKRQEIRFSGDLDKNAAIALRRKPKE
jgi:hypothetical protein